MALVAGAVMVIAYGIVMAQPARAADSCHGDWCSNRNPMTTGIGGVPCAEGARTVASARVTLHFYAPGATPENRYEDVGYIELRWSDRCQTNWARLTMERSGYVNKVVAEQDTGYRQEKTTAGYWMDTNPGTYYTNMIYSPARKVRAKVECRGATGCGALNATAWR